MFGDSAGAPRLRIELAHPSLEAYVVIDGDRRTVTVYRPDAGARTFDELVLVALAHDLRLEVSRLFV